MSKLGRKIAISIILGGVFIMVCFMAIEYQNLTLSLYGIVITLLIFIFLFGFAMGQSFASPVNEVLKGAYHVSKGEASKINLQNKTKDEIDDLAKVFNEITQDFQGVKEEVETVKKSSDIKFKTKELLSEQIIASLEEKVRNRTADLEKAVSDLENVKHQLIIKDEQIYNLTKRADAKRGKK